MCLGTGQVCLPAGEPCCTGTCGGPIVPFFLVTGGGGPGPDGPLFDGPTGPPDTSMPPMDSTMPPIDSGPLVCP
jgi:hypothetical protein